MKALFTLNRDSIIDYILLHNKKIIKSDLEKLSLEALVVIKVQVELENLKSRRQ